MLNDFLALAIFGSFTWFCVCSIALLYFFFYSEYEEQGFIAFFAAIAYCVINYFWGNVPVFHYFTWTNIALYLAIGLIYAVIRAYMFGRNLTKIENYHISELKGNVFRWWFLFPISLISWAVSDLIGDVWDWLYDRVSNGFEYIVKAGFNSKKREVIKE